MHGFELTVQQLGTGTVSIRLRGSLDLAYAYRFDDELRHAERDASSCLVLDLRELDFVDSAGISRILAARRRARRARGPMMPQPAGAGTIGIRSTPHRPST